MIGVLTNRRKGKKISKRFFSFAGYWNPIFAIYTMADPFAASVDEDPAADFLAREQQELAGLEDDGFGGSVSGDSSY